MSVEALIPEFLRIPIFQGLHPTQLNQIAHVAERVVFRAGEGIVREGDIGDAAYLLVSGEASLTLRAEPEAPPQVVVPGSLIGELAMFIEHEYASTVVASCTIRALRIERGPMLQLLGSDPDMAEHFVHKIASRLTRLADEIKRIDRSLARMEAGELAGGLPL
jgi:CRP-like cAMP-binding protein